MKNDLELSDFRYDVERLANEICMGENKKEMYFLVEGTNDRDVFVKFINTQKVTFIICNGKESVFKVYDSVKTKNGHGNYVYAIVDLDYDWHLGGLRTDSHILYTDSHDLEIMILYSEAFEHISKGLYSNNKLASFDAIVGFRNYVSNLCIRLGLFRIVNKNLEFNLKLKANSDKEKDFPYQKFITKGDFAGDEALLNTIKNYNKQSSSLKINEVIEAMNTITRTANDEHLILHGHAVTCVMALLTKTLGKKGLDINKREEVDLYFRLAYSFDCFKKTKLFNSMQQLAQQQTLNIWKS